MRYVPAVAMTFALLTGGCGAGANAPGASSPPMARAATPQASSFAEWKSNFRVRALSEGIRPDVFDAAFQGVTENLEVVRLDGRQAEFTKPLWEYLDGAASAGLDHFLVVHGIGSGALRRAVREHLAESPYAKRFLPGAPEEGGEGVTIVDLAS